METQEKKLRPTRLWKFTDAAKEKPNVEPGVAVPGESYTVRELFDRMAKGLDVGGGKDVTYDPEADFDSDDLEKLKDLDLFEQEQIRTEMAKGMVEKEKTIKEAKAKAKAAYEEEQRERDEWKAERKAKRKEASGQPQKPQDGPEAGGTQWNKAEGTFVAYKGCNEAKSERSERTLASGWQNPASTTLT